MMLAAVPARVNGSRWPFTLTRRCAYGSTLGYPIAVMTFHDTVSYVRYGPRLAPRGTDHDDRVVYFIPEGEIGENLLELEGMVTKMKEALTRASSLGWPDLPVLPNGWKSGT